MKRILFALFILIAVNLLGISEFMKFAYGKVAIGMSYDDVSREVNGANCHFIKDKQILVCGNYKNAALLLQFEKNSLSEMTIKKDITGPEKQYSETLGLMKTIYGKPFKVFKKQLSAVYHTKDGSAGFNINQTKNGYIQLYTCCKNRKCTSLKRTLNE